MSASSALARGRVAAEALMLDTCRITKPGASTPSFNESTGQYTDPSRVTVYTGKGRLQIVRAGSDAGAGEHDWTILNFVLQVPIAGTDDVEPNHQVEVLTAAHDASLVGRKFNVAQTHHKSDATSRRFVLTEVVK